MGPGNVQLMNAINSESMPIENINVLESRSIKKPYVRVGIN
jgi:hypothetical protein